MVDDSGLVAAFAVIVAGGRAANACYKLLTVRLCQPCGALCAANMLGL